MQYAVVKWRFTTAVRFGTSKGQLADSDYIMHSDTLFSALCHEALLAGGEAELQKLYRLCNGGRLLLSDTMPYIGETYFLPKPLLHIERTEQESSSVLKKAYKKLKYISAEQYDSYLQSLAGKQNFDVQEAGQLLKGFVSQNGRVMAGIAGNEASKPFYVDTWTFAENAGLYVIIGYEQEEDIYWMEQLMQSLGLHGAGGKKNSGLGKFETEDVILLESAYSDGLEALQHLLTEKGDWYMTLSCALPQDDELETVLQGAAYQVLKRSGFIDSISYATEQRKHKNLFVLTAGSCFTKPFAGDIYDIANGGTHPVYRYAKPLFMGVKL